MASLSYNSIGIHPHDAKSWDEDTCNEIKEAARCSECVAIGECGLDFNRNFSPPETQIEVFEKQVQYFVKIILKNLSSNFENILGRLCLLVSWANHYFYMRGMHINKWQKSSKDLQKGKCCANSMAKQKQFHENMFVPATLRLTILISTKSTPSSQFGFKQI